MSSLKFRETFQLVTKKSIQWFPGHMGKGLKQMQQKLKSVDCIIEVHDARIPFSGRNPEFNYTVTGIKPHILVLNKKDLGEPRFIKDINKNIKLNCGIDHIIYTNCKDPQCSGVRKIIPTVTDLIVNSNRFNRSEEKDYCVMVIGVPNVGKSSVLNVLRNRHLKQRKASAVGGVAGITRSVLNKIKISEDPLIYMVDTPGILTPNIANDDMGMKLALCGCLPDHLVGEDLIADYLLYWLNKNKKFEYVEFMGLQQPTDHIQEVLVSASKKLQKTKKIKNYDGRLVVMPDMIYAAQFMIKLFRNGHFGKINLDKGIIKIREGLITENTYN